MRHLAACYKVIDVTLFLESLEPFEIENRDTAIADAHEPCLCQFLQRAIDSLSGKTHQVRKLLL